MRICWTERRTRVLVIQIFHNHRRFPHGFAVIDDGGHDTSGIELQILGLLLITGSEIKMATLPRKPFFRQGKANFLGTCRHIIVIKLQHSFVLYWPAGPVRYRSIRDSLSLGNIVSLQDEAESLKETRPMSGRVFSYPGDAH